MKCEIRDICGDYALDIVAGNSEKVTIYFNSRQNALNVKRILEVDDSIPNAATVCDMQEVVRCKDCKYRTWFVPGYECGNFESPFYKAADEDVSIMTKPDDYCSLGERKDSEDYCNAGRRC